jgi:transcriptional regulator with XRE-family HTH domain
LTQRQFAARLGIAALSLLRYENGQRRIPKVLAIAARCVADHQGR